MVDQKNPKGHLSVEEALTESEAFILKYKNLILGAIAAIIIIIAAIVLYKNYYSEPRENKAQVALIAGQNYFEKDQFELALNGDSLGYGGFQKVIDDFSGTKAANLAHAYAGISYKNLKQYDKAIEELDKFSGKDAMVAPSMLGAIGNSYAELNQPDKAASYLMDAAKAADNGTLSPIFLLQAGEIYMKLNDYDAAIKAYTQIKEKHQSSYQAMDIDKYIERAKLLKK